MTRAAVTACPCALVILSSRATTRGPCRRRPRSPLLLPSCLRTRPKHRVRTSFDARGTAYPHLGAFLPRSSVITRTGHRDPSPIATAISVTPGHEGALCSQQHMNAPFPALLTHYRPRAQLRYTAKDRHSPRPRAGTRIMLETFRTYLPTTVLPPFPLPSIDSSFSFTMQ